MADDITKTDSVSVGEAGNAAPSLNEAELWDWLQNAANEAERVRRDEAQFDRFKEWLDIFSGKHWPENMPTFRPPIVANELRQIILQEASELSESHLRVYIMPNPQSGGRDKAAEKAFRAVWVRNQIDYQLMLASVWALVLGTGFIEVSWDPDAFYGYGDVVVESRDPRTVLPDPDAVDDKKWMFRITETILDLQEVRRLFPVKGYLVKPEDKWSVKAPSGYGMLQRTASYLGPLYSGPMASSSATGYKSARVRVLDCILRSDEVETVVEEELDAFGAPLRDDAGNPKLKQITKPKYPNGRRIVGANGVILYDGPSPNPRPDDFGLLRIVLEPTLDRFWGLGFVQQTDQLQLAANKLLSSLVENAIRLNNGVMIATGNTGLDLESFAGIPGQIININPGSHLTVSYPPPMPPDMVQAPWRMLDLQKRLLGYQDARAGIASGGNVSVDLTETEISQSQASTRLRSRLLYHQVQRLAEMIFSRMAHGYTTRRVIPATEGQEFSPVQWEPIDKPDEYAVYVDPASFVVMSRTMLKRVGTLLYKLRAIDRRSLLESIGWPDWEETAKRLDKAEQLAALARIYGKKGA